MTESSDVIDVANKVADTFVQEAIARTLSKSEENLAFKGSCHYCNEPTSSPLRFCDDYCRDDYDYLKSRQAVNIRV